MISKLSNTKAILQKNNLKAKKGFGQNFLVDENILQKIIKTASIDKETGIIEIGPGMGSLTQYLALSSKKVLCYEIDIDMINVLKETLADYKNVCIINKDILKADIESDFKYFDDCNRVLVVANLPYYITTAIITKLLEIELPIQEYFFMVQKEVAYRLTSKPSTKDYNALSVLMAYKSISKIEFIVNRNSFYPVPNVDSAIISVLPSKVDLELKSEPNFMKFIQFAFCQRRKTIVNNISSSYKMDKQKIQSVLSLLNINESVRSEELNLDQLSKIYKELFE